MTSVALFTRDLRVHDNPVLHAAAGDGEVVPLFVVDDGIGAAGYLAPNRATFLTQSLTDLNDALTERGARLVIRTGDLVEQVRAVAAQIDAGRVHIAADVSAYAQRRVERLRAGLAEDRRELIVHEGVVTAVPPGEIIPAGGDHMAVFTPYHRRWADHALRRPLPAPRTVRMPRIAVGELPRAEQLCRGEASPELMPGGERAGRERLSGWAKRVERYDRDNDLMALDGTSRLSPYLHFGCLSATEVVHRMGAGSPGAEAFTRQVAWRDFHHQVLAARPACSREDYRDRGDRWRSDPEEFDAWCAGRTGYPIVDAGMRQLRAEGWMHNRARLITGSFLTKTLYLDWREGARHFLHWLVDGDIANNQMNWQWMAGTGTDTRPNRVLNPLRQAERYDPDGDYVRRFVPELAGIPGSAVHEPWRLAPEMRPAGYPAPIVDLAEGRDRFLAARR